jgi:hypothetical protein
MNVAQLAELAAETEVHVESSPQYYSNTNPLWPGLESNTDYRDGKHKKERK